MKVNKEDRSINHQSHPRQEGQENNIRPSKQQLHDTNAEAMSNMKQEGAPQQNTSDKNRPNSPKQ